MVMKALVTGSAGFIGRHMVRELDSRGYIVHGCDILTDDSVNTFLNETWELCNRPVYDLVVHCSYNVGGRAAIDGVNNNFAKNLQLDAAMFEWAVRTRQRRVLYFSSSAAYPLLFQTKNYLDLMSLDTSLESDDLRLSENLIFLHDVKEPDSNYGWAKLTGERLAEDARKNGLDVTVVRPFSGYGEDQSLDYPFTSILRRASSGDLTVWGPSGQTRDWIHVSDVVQGSLAIVDSGTTDPVNLCTGRGVEMGDLARMTWKMSAQPADYDDYGELLEPEVQYLPEKPTGVFYRVGDPTRMLKYYEPKVSLEEGIRRALNAVR